MGRNLACVLAAASGFNAYMSYISNIYYHPYPISAGFGIFHAAVSGILAVGAVDSLLEEHFKYTEKKLEKL